MSGENIDPNQEQNTQDENNGAEILAQMPKFEEHMKSFSEAKQNGEVPEGVRDEQDYKEYLAEQEARNKEFEKFDNGIFEGIMSIENPDDRDLATAILPYYYNDELDENADRGRKDIAKREAMKAVVGYMDSDKTKSLEDVLMNIAEKFYHDSRYNWQDNAAAARAVINTDKLNYVIEGHRLEQLDVSEAEVREYGYKFAFTDPNGREHSHFFEYNRYYETEEEKDDDRIIINLANDITKKIKESENYDGTLEDRINLRTLARLHQYGDKEYLKEEKENRLREVLESSKTIMESGNFNASESVLSFANTGLLGLICVDGLESELNSYQRNYTRYKQALKVGRAILNREKDWHEVNFVENLIREK